MQINICKIFISIKCSSPATTNPAASNLQMQCYVIAFSSLRKDYFALKRVKYFNKINWMRNICMFKIKSEDDTVKYFFWYSYFALDVNWMTSKSYCKSYSGRYWVLCILNCFIHVLCIFQSSPSFPWFKWSWSDC